MCACALGTDHPPSTSRHAGIMHDHRQLASVQRLSQPQKRPSHYAYARDRDVGETDCESRFAVRLGKLHFHEASTMKMTSALQFPHFLRQSGVEVTRYPRHILSMDSALLEPVESPLSKHRCDYCGSTLRGDQFTDPCPSCGASHDGGEAIDTASVQYDQPSRPNRTEAIGVVWEWLETVLRSQSNGLRGSSTRNDKLEAWLSDCALEVCEAIDDDLMDCYEAGELTGAWESRLGLLAFRRRVNGWDTGEVLSRSGDVPKAIIDQRLQTEEFWDKVPQHGTDEDDDERCEDSAVFAAALAEWSLADDDSLLRSIVAICETPDFSGREQAKSAKMSKSQHYNNLAKLRTRLTLGGLLELAIQG